MWILDVVANTLHTFTPYWCCKAASYGNACNALARFYVNRTAFQNIQHIIPCAILPLACVQPLTEVNMLKALLVSRQDSKTKAGKKLIKQLTDDWMQVESSLAALLAAMEEKVDKSGKNSMAARANTAPYNNTLAHDIASQHLPYGVEPTMFDELLEHIRTIHDPHQSCRPSSSIAFFTKVCLLFCGLSHYEAPPLL